MTNTMANRNRSNIYLPPSTAQSESLTGTPLASFTRRALALWIDMLVAGSSPRAGGRRRIAHPVRRLDGGPRRPYLAGASG